MLGVIFVYEKLTNTATLWKLTSTSKFNIDLARNQKFLVTLDMNMSLQKYAC